jgi:hypothetical protein
MDGLNGILHKKPKSEAGRRLQDALRRYASGEKPKVKQRVGDIESERLRTAQKNLWYWLDENFSRLGEEGVHDEFERKQKMYDVIVRELTKRGVKTMDLCPVCRQEAVDLERHLRFANDAEHQSFLESQEAKADLDTPADETVDNHKLPL